jgi:hypothetical protein
MFLVIQQDLTPWPMCFRMCEMKDGNDELPADFDNEIHKWSLECEYKHIWRSKLSADNWIAVDVQYDKNIWQQWVGLQVLKDYNVQVGIVVYWFVPPCSLIGEYQCCRGTCCLYVRCRSAEFDTNMIYDTVRLRGSSKGSGREINSKGTLYLSCYRGPHLKLNFLNYHMHTLLTSTSTYRQNVP